MSVDAVACEALKEISFSGKIKKWEQELTCLSAFSEFLSPVQLRDARLRCSPSAVLDYATDQVEMQIATAVPGVSDVNKEV